MTLCHFVHGNAVSRAGEHEQATQRMTVESVHAALDEVWPGPGRLSVAEDVLPLRFCVNKLLLSSSIDMIAYIVRALDTLMIQLLACFSLTRFCC